MPRSLMIYGSVAVLVAAGVFEGLRTNRWGQTDDMKAAVARLGGVPAAFGDWTSAEQPIEEKVLRVAEATGNVSRTYTNRGTGSTVSVLILCGPPGPIGAHTPDICYAGIGFEMDGKEERRTVTPPNGQPATYWQAKFQRQATGEDKLRVAWAWGVDGDWQAAAAPRREFVMRSALYKIYVSCATPADRESNPPVDRIQEFLADFLPEVKKALAPTAG